MSNGINKTNAKYIVNYEDFRFQDASHAIFSKYTMMGLIKPTAGVTTTMTSAQIGRDRQETTVRSQACTIL